MIQNKQKLIYTSITIIATILCIIIVYMTHSNISPSGKVAGNVTTSDVSVSINNQLITAYNLKSGVYIAIEDLQLFGFRIEQTDTSLKISTPQKSHINREYIVKLSRIEENENAFYPKKQVVIDDAKISSYTTKKYTLIPVSTLRRFGKCSKESNSTLLTCDLYN